MKSELRIQPLVNTLDPLKLVDIFPKKRYKSYSRKQMKIIKLKDWKMKSTGNLPPIKTLGDCLMSSKLQLPEMKKRVSKRKEFLTLSRDDGLKVKKDDSYIKKNLRKLKKRYNISSKRQLIFSNNIKPRGSSYKFLQKPRVLPKIKPVKIVRKIPKRKKYSPNIIRQEESSSEGEWGTPFRQSGPNKNESQIIQKGL